jgi:CO/xanthine dehydrogenase Mo-binding subunit
MVAQIVSVSIEDKKIKVHKVVCVVDCGVAVNPDIVRGQMEGGIVFALTAALKGNISVVDGAVQQSNFHNYELLRMNETPEIEVHILESAEAPTGVGEPGVPPLAPALANAVYAASGQRLRQLPLKLV